MRMILEYLEHLWAVTPEVPVLCPAVGNQSQDQLGYVTPHLVAAAWSVTFWLSLVSVLLIVVYCYSGTRMTTGPGFSRRWVLFLPLSGIAAALVALVVLKTMPFYVEPGSCDMTPDAFAVTLPMNIVWMRVLAGAFWGVGAFALLSVLLTKTLGRVSWNTGFFQNRGTPLPRFMPTRRSH